VPDTGHRADLPTVQYTDLVGRLAELLVDPAVRDTDPHGALAAECASARDGLGAAAVSIAVLDGDHLVYRAAAGEGAASIIGTRLPVARGLAGYAAVSGQSLSVARPTDDPRFAQDVAESTGFVPHSLLVVPVVVDGEVLGVLSVLDRVVDDLPAWSEPFHDRRPSGVPLPQLRRQIRRDWAFGDGRGRGVRVAVVDSGIDADHPAIRGVEQAVVVERDDRRTRTASASSTRPHDDLYGHGTACAGVIRALAPEVEIVSVRVLSVNLKGSAFVFAHGLEWCIDNGLHVLNLSLSTGNEDFAETFWELLDHAAFKRVMLVSAMNNEPKRSIPSEFAGVFSVACAPGTDRERLWYNPNGPAEWGAAGIDVDVSWSGGGTINASGNSFAAPVIAGHLARILGAHPSITPAQARTVLTALAANPE
jgi:subtilisin